MKFEIDHQTIKDLQLFGDDRSSSSIFKFYNKTKTTGGSNRLREIMSSPTNDLSELDNRISTLTILLKTNKHLNLNNRQFDFIEHYLKLNLNPLKQGWINSKIDAISERVKPTGTLYTIQSGIENLRTLFQDLALFTDTVRREKKSPQFQKQTEFISSFLSNPLIESIYKVKLSDNLNSIDNTIRLQFKSEIRTVIDFVYEIDALQSAAITAAENNLVFPEYINNDNPKLSVEALYHPLIKNAVTNDIGVDESHNMIFLTGANMAGKSTLLKSLGLSIYLAHIGFPVPAKKFQTTIYNGIITTINLPDNINKGYSHFYHEVIRVKETALKIKESKHIFVIFDELFRGTNVKDAYDASLLIISAFAKIRTSTFLISTHITEIAEDLKSNDTVQFNYLESKLIDAVPTYTYKLAKGVSDERVGLLIVKNEGIIEILYSIETDK